MKPTTLGLAYNALKPFIFGLNVDAEFMHTKAYEQIRRVSDYEPLKFGSLGVDLFGHHFNSPLMLAAGFDKYGFILDKVEYFGFAGEVLGSITALGGDGNKEPRLFRLVEEMGALNRMGLNNDGSEITAERLDKLDYKGIFAVSIAKTHNPGIIGDKAIDDYVKSYRLLKQFGLYTEINVSCPNTKEGKTFENPRDLELLLNALISEGKGKPMLVKLSPNLGYETLRDLVAVSDNKVDGYVATNTMPYEHPIYGKGGFSGLPLQKDSIDTIRRLKGLTKKPIIGVGGIFTGKDAFKALEAGAVLLQGLTGFIYRGPLYTIKVTQELDKELKDKGLKHISRIVKD